MTIYRRSTPVYESEIFNIPASRWILYMRTTLDLLERDLREHGDLESIVKQAEARTVIQQLDREVMLIIEVKEKELS